MGAQGEGPKGPKRMQNFKHLLLQIAHRRIVKLCQCVDTLLDEEQKLFMAVPRVAPMGPCGPFVNNVTVCIFFWKSALLDFNKKWQESSLRGRGFKVVQIVCVAPMGAPGGGPAKGQNHANFKHLLLQIQKENSQVM